MPSETLVVADYPVGHASGFGETLYNLFDGFPVDKLWTAHPSHTVTAAGKTRAESIKLPSPSRPQWLPHRVLLAYYPFLKVQQFRASRDAVRLLRDVVKRNSIKSLLVIPVSPWILNAALALHRQCPQLKLVVYVMDDWQGHHESYKLPYSTWRQRLLAEVINRASVRFAVSREMAAHYEETFGKNWLVVHNGVANTTALTCEASAAVSSTRVLLAGDVNVFRFDAVLAFAEAIERYNQRGVAPIQLTVMGEVAEEHRRSLAALRAVTLLKRQSHSECLDAMKDANLLYLPLAFGKHSSRISLYSLPTKLPEYLASGKSVLFHAPKQSAVYRVAERYDLTPRLATIDRDALDEFVASCPKSGRNGNENMLKAKRALQEEFNLQRLAARFQAAFA
jgi:glycosyl transferase family 4